MLPSVHGILLARMLRHMLETPGTIDERDYERLSFVYGILLSDSCQVRTAFWGVLMVWR